MKHLTPIHTRLFLSFLGTIAVLGCLIGFFGYQIIKSNIIDRAQTKLKLDLKNADAIITDDIDLIRRALVVAATHPNPTIIANALNLDYFRIMTAQDTLVYTNPVIRDAFAGNDMGVLRNADSIEISQFNSNLLKKIHIPREPSPDRSKNSCGIINQALVIECAAPVINNFGSIDKILIGGRILNNNFSFIDKIQNSLYENNRYQGKPTGAASLFLGDIRVSTTVLNQDGNRAVGTKSVGDVSRSVLLSGKTWLNRAVVITDWYLSAYKPLKDESGNIIGMLFVGVLEKPYTDLLLSKFIQYIAILSAFVLLSVLVTFLLAKTLANPLTALSQAASRLGKGNLNHRIKSNSSLREIIELTDTFNEMADKLSARETALNTTNSDLSALNTRYLDLIAIVSHELKGILSTAVFNACAVRDGHYGPITPKQRIALDAITRNLDFFDATIRNFLSLSRVEKDELKPSPITFNLDMDCIAPCINQLEVYATARHMTIDNIIPSSITISADINLLRIVFNNLLNNAITYGDEKGTIRLSANYQQDKITIDIYNDGTPLTEGECTRLFKRFSRLENPKTILARGTGLGLFISHQIIENHQGTLCCIPRKTGNSFVITLPGSSFQKPLQ
jgi:two-component system NtrC family sensor kinase